MDIIEDAYKNLSTRRHLLRSGSAGIGSIALNSMLAPEALASQVSEQASHFAPKAKRIIFLFMNGAPAQQDLFDYKPFETWQEEGGLDTMTLASKRVKNLLDNYAKPSLEVEVEEALNAFVNNKKASMPDSFT